MESFVGIVVGLVTFWSLLSDDNVWGHGCGAPVSSSHNQQHLTPTDDSVWSSLFPDRSIISTASEEEEDEEKFKWMMRYRIMKNSNNNDDDDVSGVNNSFLKEVSLHDVRLDPESEQGQAQQTNLEYLLMLEVNNLTWSFRQTAGLPTPGRPYGGWEAPDVQLRGHFVGHYLSASAQMWASTHNDTLHQKMSAVVSALSDCQDKMGTGYLSAFPTEFFDRLENLEKVWAPYYTIHKIMAGLLDQHLLVGNKKALKMVKRMVDYFYNRIRKVILTYTIQRHWQYSTKVETGGMNDVLYQLYSLTGDKKHLLMAQLFDRPYFQGALALKADDLSGIHANTHIPIIVGSQTRYEVTGDPIYKEIPIYFMDTVNSSYSYATGGTSVDEYWSYPKRLASTLQTENQESCTTYNMLKVSRNLFRWTKEMSYADYYERALTNGVLGIQRGKEPGVMIYMLPMGRGVSKANTENRWGDPFNSFWCCYGTGIESFSKLGDSIYFLEDGDVPGVYVIQYISSSLNWTAGQMVLTQKVEPVVSWDGRLRVTLTVSSSSSSHKQPAGKSSLHLRIPTYSKGAKALLNGEKLSLPGPGNFLSVTRKWNPNDTITLELPLTLRTEAIKDDRPGYASLHAVLYGPYLLAGLSSGDWDISGSPTTDSLSDFILPVHPSHHSHLISLSQQSGKTSKLVFTNYNGTIAMEDYPNPGTDPAVHATFRLVLNEPTNSSGVPTKPRDFVGKSVLLVPIDFPGALLAHQGEDRSLVVVKGGGGGGGGSRGESVFRLVPGLDGGNDTVSLESVSQEGCFVYSGVVIEPGTFVTLSCRKNGSGFGFAKGASFQLNDGLRQFHPISFVAKGVERDFVLAPLFSLRDESYTVYFNFRSSVTHPHRSFTM